MEAACRPDGFNGPPPIPPSEITCWADQKLIELSTWEFEQFLMLDRIRRSVWFENQKKNRKAQEQNTPQKK